MQAAAEGPQARIEVLPLGFVGKELFKLLHVLFVADSLEQVPKLVVELRQLADFFPDVVHRADKIVLIEALEGAVGRKCSVKLAK